MTGCLVKDLYFNQQIISQKFPPQYWENPELLFESVLQAQVRTWKCLSSKTIHIDT